MIKEVRDLEERGVRITPQRLTVYKILKRKGHATAEEIYEEVRKSLPRVSLSTVYSILEAFKEKGMANEIRINFDRSTFDINTREHHHFYCRVCGKILDIEIEPCQPLRSRDVRGHRIECFEGYFFGVCRECKKG